MEKPVRSRPYLAISLLAVIALGLASRKFAWLFPATLGKYPGDSLWAFMVFLGIAFIKPRIRPMPLAGLALVASFGVEFSQLYQAPWINIIRGTTLGHLVLGSAFAWQDLVAYVFGIAAGGLFDITHRGRAGIRERNGKQG